MSKNAKANLGREKVNFNLLCHDQHTTTAILFSSPERRYLSGGSGSSLPPEKMYVVAPTPTRGAPTNTTLMHLKFQHTLV